MKGETDPPAVLHDLVPRRRSRPATNGTRPTADFDPAAPPEAAEKFEALRRCRTELARDHAVPPYVVASNRTLQAVALAEPATLEELIEVPGMGPKKAEQFGQALLDALGDRPDPPAGNGDLRYVPD